jgi:DNA-binding NtrC family response regulator
MVKPLVLLVEDDPGLRFVLRDHLESCEFEVEEAGSIGEAKAAYLRSMPDAVVLDYKLPDGDTVELLYSLRAVDPGVPFVMLTGHGSIDLAVRAIKAGAGDFLVKPVALPVLTAVIRRLLSGRPPPLQADARSKRMQEDDVVDVLTGESRAVKTLIREVGMALGSPGPILLQGETGTGKGVLARWLHRHGRRRERPFVDLNCAGLHPEFLESELFGHARGAYTGAVTDKKGLLEVANGGTFFLDEIGELGLTVQAKLLKALEEQRFRRMGETTQRTVDLFLISATHHDLAEEARSHAFRSDLYFRISTFPLRLPSLRERREDLPLFATEMLRNLCQASGRPAVTLTAEALAAITSYAWPGNFREMRNVLELAVLRAPGLALRREDLKIVEVVDVKGTTLEEIKFQQVEAVLREEHGRVAAAARRLGMPRSTLYLKIREWNIDLKKFQI